MEVLAELVARITADATELKKALAESEKAIQGTGKAIDKETKSISERFKEIGKAAGVMGAAITASMGAMILSFDKTGSELHDLALKTGVSVEALAGLKYAAEQNGASLGTVEMAIRRTASAMQDASEGLAETQRAFDRMGVSLSELQGLNPEEQFLKIASAIAEIPDPMTRAATAQDLFGRSGMDMLPMLAAGADGLKKMMTEGQKLSGWTTANAKLADDFGDALTTLKTSMSGATNAVGAALAPALKDLAGLFTNLSSMVANVIREQPELAKALGGAALAVGVLATAVGGLAVAVAFLGAAFWPVTLAMVVVGGLTAAFIALKDTIWPVNDTVKIIGATVKETAAIWDKELTNMKASAKKLYDEVVEKADKFGDQIIKALQKRNETEEKADLAKNQTLIDANRDKTDSLIKNLERETRETIKHYENMLSEVERSIDSQIRAENKRHKISIENWNEEEKNRLRDLRNKTKDTLSGLDTEIKAIQDAQDADDKKSQTIQDNARRDQYEQDISIAMREGNALKALKLTNDLAAFEKSLIARGTKETRQAEIEKLQIKQSAVRDAASTTAEIISDSYKTVKKTEEKKVEKVIDGLKTVAKEQKDITKEHIDDLTEGAKTETETILATGKTEEENLKKKREAILEHYKNLNSDAVIQAKAVSLALATDQTELITLLTSYNPQWQNAGQSFGKKLLDGLNSMKEPIANAVDAILAKVGKAKAATEAYTVEQMVAESTAGAQAAQREVAKAQTGGFGFGGFGITEFAEGGIVTKPTLALVGEHGAEAITPLSKAGGVTIIFEGAVYGFKDFESRIAQAVKNHTIRGGFHGVLKGA